MSAGDRAGHSGMVDARSVLEGTRTELGAEEGLVLGWPLGEELETELGRMDTTGARPLGEVLGPSGCSTLQSFFRKAWQTGPGRLVSLLVEC
jgi:hypothetical protein